MSLASFMSAAMSISGLTGCVVGRPEALDLAFAREGAMAPSCMFCWPWMSCFLSFFAFRSCLSWSLTSEMSAAASPEVAVVVPVPVGTCAAPVGVSGAAAGPAAARCRGMVAGSAASGGAARRGYARRGAGVAVLAGQAPGEEDEGKPQVAEKMPKV